MTQNNQLHKTYKHIPKGVFMNMISLFSSFCFPLLSLTLITSCATIMHGTRQSVEISSHPGNASIWVDQQYVGNTPLIVDMTRKHNHFVTIALDGYETYEIKLTRKISGWAVFGGLAGLAMDAIAGGLYNLTPEQVQAQMQPTDAL